jgi:hypothetical protein
MPDEIRELHDLIRALEARVDELEGRLDVVEGEKPAPAAKPPRECPECGDAMVMVGNYRCLGCDHTEEPPPLFVLTHDDVRRPDGTPLTGTAPATKTCEPNRCPNCGGTEFEPNQRLTNFRCRGCGAISRREELLPPMPKPASSPTMACPDCGAAMVFIKAYTSVGGPIPDHFNCFQCGNADCPYWL